MTPQERLRIEELRSQGLSFNEISKRTGISANTIKSYCRRNGVSQGQKPQESPKKNSVGYCKECGVPVEQTPGRKVKMFCSNRCRNRWWNRHLGDVDRKAYTDHVCANCGKPFRSYANRNRKYCCHECYIEARFGKEEA